MATTYPFTKDSIKKIIKKVTEPLLKINEFWNISKIKFDQWTQLAFRLQGARSGSPAWPTWNKGLGFNVLGGTTLTKAGTRKIRYGTDIKTKWPNNLGRPSRGASPGYIRVGVRRYTGASKLLQASGSFRRSFGKIRQNKSALYYGTKFELAEKIMSNPIRNVLFITPQDEKEIQKMWYLFNDKNIRL